MRRVTRAGGFVTACVWDFAGHRGPLGPFWDAARSIAPDVDDESARAGTREGHLVELFELAGLTEVVGVPLPVTLAFADFDDWWDPFTFGVGPAGQLVASLDADDQARLRDRCRRALPDGAFELSAVAWAREAWPSRSSGRPARRPPAGTPRARVPASPRPRRG